MNQLLSHALQYRRRGFSVIPMKAKKPTVRWTPFSRTLASEDLIRRWFARSGPDGLAVICGSVSGNLCVRDFDDLRSYEKWAEANPTLAAMLPTVETGRPGRHVYFRNGIHRIRKLSDGELRGAGCCLLPPSMHVSGKQYRWLIPLPQGTLPSVPT